MLGALKIVEHHLEFILGQGMLLDGVVVPGSSVNGPWVWTVPADAFDITAQGCGAGGGGGSGWMTGIAQAAGGGGASGTQMLGIPIYAPAGTELTIAIGAKGIGGTAEGVSGTAGGNTTITGIPRMSMLTATPGVFVLPGGSGGDAAQSDRSGAAGSRNGASGRPAAVLNGATGVAGGTAGLMTSIGLNESYHAFMGIDWAFCTFGGAGGNAATGGTNSGGNGGGYVSHTGGNFGNLFTGYSTLPIRFGTTSGGVSYGGGSYGGYSMFGLPPVPGNGGQSAVAGSGFGFGGAGGAGGGAGGGTDGGDGYLRITYMMME